LKWAIFLLCGFGAALLAFGFIAGAAPLAAGAALLTFGVVRMQTGILGAVRTQVPRGIALTFDDGPDPHSTPLLLDLLKERGARATFFMIGEKVLRHPDVVRRCHAEGHTIANHSHHHGTWTNLHFGAWMRDEIGACQRAIEETIGSAPRFYRPPFGLMNPHVEAAARDHGLELVAWSIRSLDTVRDDAAERVVRALAPGAIVLLHDGGIEPERVVATTRSVLEAAAERGLEAIAL
jgi:peptidoglycan/xylan/chitin deacetylase (PgdA/CDA1 family)